MANLIKQFTLVNYDSRVVVKQFPSQYDSSVVIYKRKLFIRLATGPLMSEASTAVLTNVQQPTALLSNLAQMGK